MCTVHRNRTLYRRHIRNVYCAQRQNTFKTVHQKCVLCTQTEHFPGCTHKAVFTDHKKTFMKKTQRFTAIHVTPTYLINTNEKTYIGCTKKEESYVWLSIYVTCICWYFERWWTLWKKWIILNKVIYRFYVRHSLTVCFLPHCDPVLDWLIDRFVLLDIS